VGDRVPIGPFTGLASGLVGVDLILASLGKAGTVTRVWLARSGAGAGVVTADVRNATGGGGSGLSAAFGGGDLEATATGTLAVAAGESIYLRVTAADAITQDLRGWFEVEGAAGVVGTALTTLARVKQHLGIADSSKDALLSDVIAGVSARMQAEMGRTITERAIVGELHDGPRGDTLYLDEYPVDSATVVLNLNGTLVDSTTYAVEEYLGGLVAVDEGEAGAWERGRLNYSVDYTAGYATVPEDLALAATRQAAFVALEALNRDRLGSRSTVLDSGGSSEFVTTEWLAGVLATLRIYKARRYR